MMVFLHICSSNRIYGMPFFPPEILKKHLHILPSQKHCEESSKCDHLNAIYVRFLAEREVRDLACRGMSWDSFYAPSHWEHCGKKQDLFLQYLGDLQEDRHFVKLLT